jgi:hypothetical protein
MDVCTRSGFPARSCRTRLDRGDTRHNFREVGSPWNFLRDRGFRARNNHLATRGTSRFHAFRLCFLQATSVPEWHTPFLSLCPTNPQKSLPSLMQLSLRRDRKPESKPVDQQTCGGLVRRSSDAVSSTRPKLPSVITDTALMLKSGGFGSDRQRAICSHDTRGFVDLARVYVAWNQPADAIQYVRKSGMDPVRDIGDPFTLNNLGNAFRLAGVSKVFWSSSTTVATRRRQSRYQELGTSSCR